MNRSSDNPTDVLTECFYGECEYVDNISCLQTNRPENFTGGDLLIDEEGCFSTNHLRTTEEYQQYQMVRKSFLNQKFNKSLKQLH